MRLTKTMKDSLYTIIKNKSIPPFTTKDEEEFTKEIQENEQLTGEPTNV